MFSRFKYKDGKTVTQQLNCDIFFLTGTVLVYPVDLKK